MYMLSVAKYSYCTIYKGLLSELYRGIAAELLFYFFFKALWETKGNTWQNLLLTANDWLRKIRDVENEAWRKDILESVELELYVFRVF